MIILFERKEECCGCTACKSICPVDAIKMAADEEGFQYPVINHSVCIKCGLCKKVCVLQNGYDISNNFSEPVVYAMKHKFDEVRLNSSSGGAFTAISDYILSEKKGLVYGAAYDEDFRVVHKRAETPEHRDQFRGSKYVQSDLMEVFREIYEDLKDGRFVLFSGTGCQVAALNSYLSESRIDSSKLLTVDFICHGTPSPIIFKDFVALLERKNNSKLIDYRFRSKVNGWGHTEEAKFESGKSDHTSKLSQCHKELFYSNLCLRPACYECKYTNFQRPGNITIADYWGIQNFMPEFMDQAGVSAMILNNTKGKELFYYMGDSIVVELSNIHDCAKRQANLFEPSPKNPRRDEFWKDYTKYGFEYIAKKYSGLGFKKRIRGLMGLLRRRVGLYDIVKKAIKS